MTSPFKTVLYCSDPTLVPISNSFEKRRILAYAIRFRNGLSKSRSCTLFGSCESLVKFTIDPSRSGSHRSLSSFFLHTLLSLPAYTLLWEKGVLWSCRRPIASHPVLPSPRPPHRLAFYRDPQPFAFPHHPPSSTVFVEFANPVSSPRQTTSPPAASIRLPGWVPRIRSITAVFTSKAPPQAPHTSTIAVTRRP